jgi:hypothetical protein
MIRLRAAAASISLAVLSACANPVQMTKPGGTQAEYERDSGICMAQAERAKRAQLRPREATQAHNRVLLACMRDRGWEQVAG